jgi:hypothetical protein
MITTNASTTTSTETEYTIDDQMSVHDLTKMELAQLNVVTRDAVNNKAELAYFLTSMAIEINKLKQRTGNQRHQHH